ncbi:MAG: hypothetical protein LBN40_04895 [Oscillospiraceae bacterium]|jgi:hypothetical protein|nr:hypothetical protein [Oscillospiraceae bacterium]
MNIICPGCSAKLEAESLNFCPKCGLKLPPIIPDPKKSAEEEPPAAEEEPAADESDTVVVHGDEITAEAQLAFLGGAMAEFQPGAAAKEPPLKAPPKPKKPKPIKQPKKKKKKPAKKRKALSIPFLKPKKRKRRKTWVFKGGKSYLLQTLNAVIPRALVHLVLTILIAVAAFSLGIALSYFFGDMAYDTENNRFVKECVLITEDNVPEAADLRLRSAFVRKGKLFTEIILCGYTPDSVTGYKELNLRIVYEDGDYTIYLPFNESLYNQLKDSDNNRDRITAAAMMGQKEAFDAANSAINAGSTAWKPCDAGYVNYQLERAAHSDKTKAEEETTETKKAKAKGHGEAAEEEAEPEAEE